MDATLVCRHVLIPCSDGFSETTWNMRFLGDGSDRFEVGTDREHERAGSRQAAECLSLGAEVNFF